MASVALFGSACSKYQGETASNLSLNPPKDRRPADGESPNTRASAPSGIASGEEVIYPWDNYFCVRAWQMKLAARSQFSSEDPRHPDQICLENARNICKATGFETLLGFERRPANPHLSEVGNYLIHHDPDFYEFQPFRVLPQNDFIAAQDSEPAYTTEIFTSVRCSDPSPAPLVHRGAIFQEQEDPPQGAEMAELYHSESNQVHAVTHTAEVPVVSEIEAPAPPSVAPPMLNPPSTSPSAPSWGDALRARFWAWWQRVTH